MTRTPKSIQYILLHYRSIPCLNALVGSVRYLITLRKYRLFYYIVELCAKFLNCWASPNPKTLFTYTHFYCIAKQFRISIHWWAILNPNTLFRYTQHYYIAELYPILEHCRIKGDHTNDRRWYRSFRLNCPRFFPMFISKQAVKVFYLRQPTTMLRHF